LAKTAREVRFILHNELAKIDGRVVKDPRRGVGLMDVLTLGEENYRCVFDHNGRLQYRPSLQRSWHGRFAELKARPPSRAVKPNLTFTMDETSLLMTHQQYNTGDSLKLNLPDQKTSNTSASEKAHDATSSVEHTLALTADVAEYIVKRSSMPNEVQFENSVPLHATCLLLVTPHMPLTEVAE